MAPLERGSILNRKRAASIARIRAVQETLALASWAQALSKERETAEMLRDYETRATEATLEAANKTKSGMEMRRLGEETQAWRDGIDRLGNDLTDRSSESLISKDVWQQRKIASEGAARLLDKADSHEQETYNRDLANLTDDLINSRHNRSTDDNK